MIHPQVACHWGPDLDDPDFRDAASPADQQIVQMVEGFVQRHLPAVIPEVGIVEHCMYTVSINIIFDPSY